MKALLCRATASNGVNSSPRATTSLKNDEDSSSESSTISLDAAEQIVSISMLHVILQIKIEYQLQTPIDSVFLLNLAVANALKVLTLTLISLARIRVVQRGVGGRCGEGSKPRVVVGEMVLLVQWKSS